MAWENILKAKIGFKELKKVVVEWSNNNKHRVVTTEEVLNEIMDHYISEIDFDRENHRAQHKKSLLGSPKGIKMSIGKILSSEGWAWRRQYSVRVYYFIRGKEE